MSSSYGLPCKAVLHIAGPVWTTLNEGQCRANLKKTYRSIFKTVDDYNIVSLACPSISTGIFGFPVDQACKILAEEIKLFAKTNRSIRELTLLNFDDKTVNNVLTMVLPELNKKRERRQKKPETSSSSGEEIDSDSSEEVKEKPKPKKPVAKSGEYDSSSDEPPEKP